jgi:hypothetical protein
VQRRHENVQLFAERLLAIAEDAYACMDVSTAAIERQLIGFFTDGLVHDELKLCVMRDNPATLKRAVEVAMAEQNIRKRFDFRIDTKPVISKFESRGNTFQGHQNENH